MSKPRTRRIYLYNVAASFVDKGLDGKYYDRPTDLMAAFRYIEALPFDIEAPVNAYLPEAAGRTSVQVFQKEAGMILGRVGRTVLTDFPQVEKDGEFTYLDVPENAGLYEGSHFLYSCHDSLLLLEYNQRAPRQTSLANYVLEKLKNHPDIKLDGCEFRPRMKHNVLREFAQHAGPIASIEVMVHQDAVKDLQPTNELGEFFANQSQLDPTAAVLGVSFSAPPFSRTGSINRDFGRLLTELISRNRDGFHKANATRRQIDEDTRRSRAIAFDLLQDKFVYDVVVPTFNNRVIDTHGMLEKLKELYNSRVTGVR